MANRAVKIYNHVKQRGGGWRFEPVNISLDTRSTKTVVGNFKISWYQGDKKQFSKGHFKFLHDAIRAGKAKQLQLQDGNGQQPVSAEGTRVPIDVAADAYLRRVELNGRPGTYALAEHDLREWQEWNRKHSQRAFVDQVAKDDMLEYRNWIVKTGREARTAVNKTMRVNHFICQTLKLKAGDGPIKQKDAEKIIVKKATNDVEGAGVVPGPEVVQTRFGIPFFAGELEVLVAERVGDDPLAAVGIEVRLLRNVGARRSGHYIG
jgi:hypothetical protein